jgi:hypothetical protein
MGQILLAGEEAQERPTLLRNLVADRPAQHRIAGLERVEDRPQRDRAVELKFYFAANVRQRSQMLREDNANHLFILFIVLLASRFEFGASRIQAVGTSISVINFSSGVVLGSLA